MSRNRKLSRLPLFSFLLFTRSAPQISAPTPTDPPALPTETLRALELYARKTLQTLRAIQIDYAHIFQEIKLHEPRDAATTSLYRSLATDPARAADHEDYRCSLNAIPGIQRELGAVLRRFKEKNEYVYAVERGLEGFEASYRRQVTAETEVHRRFRLAGKEAEMVFEVTGPPGEALGGQLDKVRRMVKDTVAKRDVIVCEERLVVRRFDRLVKILLPAPGVVKEIVQALVGAGFLDRDRNSGEIEDLISRLARILGSGHE